MGNLGTRNKLRPARTDGLDPIMIKRLFGEVKEHFSNELYNQTKHSVLRS